MARDASRAFVYADVEPSAGSVQKPDPKNLACDFSERGQQTVDFFCGVVVDEADAEEAARFFHVEVLGEVEGVVVAVPSEESAVAEFGCEFERRVAFDPDGECGAAFVEARGIGDAVDFEARDFLHAGHDSLEQAAFVFVNRRVGGFDGGAAGERSSFA